MPLLRGKKNQSRNISELVRKYKKTGKIGTSRPEDLEKARKQAIAISFSKLK